MKNSANLLQRLVLRLAICVVLKAAVLPVHAGNEADAPGVVSSLRDYSQQPVSAATPAVVYWSWPQDVKKDAMKFGQTQVIESDGKRALSLSITDQMPWGKQESLRVAPIGPDLLPPTADAVRIRFRVLEGSVKISVGGPTIYFGHSDVQTEPVSLKASDGTGWREAVLSLHDRLFRNFRRAGFAKEAPVIYYTRWVQEPLSLYVHQGSVGRVLIERVDLLNQGRGRPAATFEPRAVEPLGVIADFTLPGSLSQVFRATHEAVDFAGPAKLARPTWTPPVLSHQAEAREGHQGVLRVEQRGTEEVAFTGVLLSANVKANAIAVDLCVSNPMPLEELSVDWVFYAAPSGSQLEWDQFRPPESWRKEPTRSFDFYLTPHAWLGKSYAFFHARRSVPNGRWTRVILPLPDFVCVHGSGAMAEFMSAQNPPSASDAAALGWLPSFRQNRQVTTFEIDRIEWVRVPGDATTLRSFPQVDPQKVILIPQGDLRQMVEHAPSSQPGH